MAEYSRIAKGHFTSTGNAQSVNLPFQPDRVEMINFTQANSAAASQNIIRAYWDVSMGQGTAVIEGYNASPALIFDAIATNGISSFSAGIANQFGPVNQHGGSPVSDFQISKANPAVVTTVGNHGLQSGQVVTFSNLFQTSTTGMQQIASIPFVITVTGATTFTIPWNTNQSNYTAFNTATSTNNAGSFKQILFPALYAPNVSFVTSLTLANPTVISLTAPGNFVVGQQVAFRIPTVWGTTQLNSLPNILTPGQSVYGSVTAVSASLTTPTITVSINATSFTAFNSNQPFASFRGELFPQVVPVADINSGSNQSNFLSPQFWNGNSNSLASSINGPEIAGAFSNNTNQGFIIGSGAGAVLTTGVLVGANTNVIFWAAYLSDLAVN